MISESAIALLAVGIVVVLITPGPTNTLLAAAGLRQGMRRSSPLIAAELAGYLVSISVWGHFFAQAEHAWPWLPSLLRVAAGLYMAYLAVDMWRAAVALPDSTQRTIGMRTLFVATLLNPKGLLFAGTIFPAIAFAHLPAYLFAMLMFACLLAPIALAWIAVRRRARQRQAHVAQSGEDAACCVDRVGRVFVVAGMGRAALKASARGPVMLPR